MLPLDGCGNVLKIVAGKSVRRLHNSCRAVAYERQMSKGSDVCRCYQSMARFEEEIL